MEGGSDRSRWIYLEAIFVSRRVRSPHPFFECRPRASGTLACAFALTDPVLRLQQACRGQRRSTVCSSWACRSWARVTGGASPAIMSRRARPHRCGRSDLEQSLDITHRQLTRLGSKLNCSNIPSTCCLSLAVRLSPALATTL